MFKKFSLYVLVSLLFVIAIVLSGCAQATQSSTPTPSDLVGIILPNETDPLWTQAGDRFNAAFEAAGVRVKILYTFTEQDVEMQGKVLVDQNGHVVQGGSYSDNELNNVQDLIRQGIKVIIIRPFTYVKPAPEAEKAREAGIKVIALDNLIYNTDAVDFYVAFDPVLIGKLEGQYLVDKATGSGNPLYLFSITPSDDYYIYLVLEGAWSVLQPKIADGTFVIKNSSEAASVQNMASLTRDEWVKIMEQIGAAHLDAYGSFTTQGFESFVSANLAEATVTDKRNMFVLAPDDFTAGVVGFKFAADSDVKNFFLTGSGASVQTVQNIIDGKQSMTILLDTRLLTDDAVATAEDYLQGRVPPQTTTYNNGKIDVPAKLSGALTIIEKSNVKTALIESGYYKASLFTGLP